MPVMTDSTLKKLRREIGYTQEDFAVMSGLRIKTYRNAEQRGRTSYQTAQSILRSLNTSRVARRMPKLSLEDLGLVIS